MTNTSATRKRASNGDDQARVFNSMRLTSPALLHRTVCSGDGDAARLLLWRLVNLVKGHRRAAACLRHHLQCTRRSSTSSAPGNCASSKHLVQCQPCLHGGLNKYLCDCSCERRFAMIDMPDCANVQVRLRPGVDVVGEAPRRKAGCRKPGQAFQCKRMLQTPAGMRRATSSMQVVRVAISTAVYERWQASNCATCLLHACQPCTCTLLAVNHQICMHMHTGSVMHATCPPELQGW